MDGKELYEPLWASLYQRSKSRHFRIRNIWIADVAHQGASGVFNEHKLGNDPSWFDHSRDLLSMVNHFRDKMPRPLVGIGHSMGAGQLMQLSLIHPRLLASLILMEPIFGTSIDACQGPTLTRQSTFRRDLWPSHEDASAASKKMYKHWDPRVLERWISHGFRALPTVIHPKVPPSEFPEADKAVTLTTTKHQEVMSYLRPNFQGFLEPSSTTPSRARERHATHADLIGPADSIHEFYRAEPLLLYQNLPHLRPSILYIFGGKSPVSTQSLRKEKMDRTGTGVGGSGGVAEDQVMEVLVEKAGHLVAQEAVEECANAAAPWIENEARHWREQEQRVAQGWAEKDQRAKTMVNEEWMARVKGKL